MKFYIVDNGKKEGPFDLLAMIRKIRSGVVQTDTMIQTEGQASPQEAFSIPKLQDIFQEKEEADAASANLTFRKHSLQSCLRGGWMFFQSNQISTVYTGVFILALIMVTTLFHFALSGFLRVPGYLAAAVLGFFGLSLYMFFILRMNRGQPTDVDFMKTVVVDYFKPLITASGCIALAASFGTILLVIPGLFVLTMYIFTPLLIIDHKMEFWDAMETSRKLVLGSGIDNMGIIFALVVINFVGGLLIFLPLLFSLPVTMSALCEMYDELFNN